MKKTTREILKRILVCILAVAMIIPSGIGSQHKAYAAGSKRSPVLCSTDYRYILVGKSYDFNIINKISGSSYTWKSSDKKVATVNKNGVVKAKKAGTATITCDILANGEKYQLSAQVYVKKAVKHPMSEVKITNKVDSLLIGGKYNLNKSCVPGNSHDSINWTSSNTNIATVDKNGIVSGISMGEVTITATALSGKVSDSVKILVSNFVSVDNQKLLEKALSSKNSKVIRIKTDKELTFNIPEGKYTGKSLVVDAPKASVNNYGVFDDIMIKAIKADTWNEYAKGNNINVNADNVRIIIETNASAAVHITNTDSNTLLEIKGDLTLYIEASGNVNISGSSNIVPKVIISQAGTVVKTDLALNIEAKQKITLVLNSKEASKTTIKVDSKELIPEVRGTGSIEVEIDGKKQTISENSNNSQSNSSTPTSTPSPTATPSPTPTPKIPESVTAEFGSPYVDGEIDDCWKDAEVIVPDIYDKTKTDVTAKHRLMWDDNALYILTEIKDSNLDKSNTSSYNQDSMELFLDENYDKGTAYKSDDLHYRVNFENMRTYDAGTSTRFYSKTKLTTDKNGATTGYIIEACIIWNMDKVKRVNGTELGFDLQINEAKGGNRATTITIYDQSGKAYQDPSQLGKLVLKGKDDGAVTGINPYSLLNYIDYVKSIYMDVYVNKDIITKPLEDAEKIANLKTSTQTEIDAAFSTLKAAVNSLDDGSGYTKASALPEVAELPDAFTFKNGTTVKTIDDWKLRQEEISKLYQYYMYGVKPDTTGEVITTEIVNSYETSFSWNGQVYKWTVNAKPNQKFIKIIITKDGKTVDFIAPATFPSTTTKDAAGKDIVTITPPTHEDGYPVLIVIGSMGDAGRQYLNDNGYAVIEFTNTEIAADDATHTGDFYTLYPYGKTWDKQTGVLAAWGWGVSKIIDVLEKDTKGPKELKISPVNTIVTGVSRNGKAAAVAGAYDSRIKVTAPASSGAGGMACFRYPSAGKTYDFSTLEKEEFIDFDGDKDGTAKWQNYQDNPNHITTSNESLSNIQAAGEGHWFNDNFQGFSSPTQLPFDQHLLASLCATPGRYYFITAEVDGGDWINHAGMYVTYLAAQNIYTSLKLGDNIGIHLHSTGHAFTLEDTKYLVEFCDKNFYGQIDGKKDLSHLKTSIFELPVNYNTDKEFFDKVKNSNKADLILYPIITVSGAAISLDTTVTGDGHSVLKVSKGNSDGYILIPLYGTTNSVITGSVTGAVISVTGTAISVSGSVISVSGPSITVSAYVMYDDDATSEVKYLMGAFSGTGSDVIDIPLAVESESVVGQNKKKWMKLEAACPITDKDMYLYIKVLNTKSYYIDNIKIK